MEKFSYTEQIASTETLSRIVSPPLLNLNNCIRSEAFHGCINLKKVYFKGTKDQRSYNHLFKENDLYKNIEIIYNFTGNALSTEPTTTPITATTAGPTPVPTDSPTEPADNNGGSTGVIVTVVAVVVLAAGGTATFFIIRKKRK